MYEFILFYCLASLSIGITSYFTLYRPMCKILKEDYGADNEESALFGGIKYIIASTVIAPLILIQTLKGCDKEFIENVLEEIEDE